MNPVLAWGSLLVSAVMIVGYEWHAHRASRHDPAHQARFVNARMRATWAEVMATQPGFEIVAVQALRNSQMSATIAASTAALALTASLTLGGASLAAGLAHLPEGGVAPLHVVLGALASYVCSAMSMRYYGNATLVVSMPVASPERKRLNPVVTDYVQRAGRLYSWALRLFMMVVPAVAGVVQPLALVPATAVLLVALHFFDQPAAVDFD
jgi:uncharacterized membrane protein